MITACKQLAGLKDWLCMVSDESTVLVAPSPVSAAQSVSGGGFPEALFHDQVYPGLTETSRVQVGSDTSRSSLAMLSHRNPEI